VSPAPVEDRAIAEQRDLLREWVRRRHGDEPIRFVETHVSILAIGVDRVWKLKKSVRFPFVDLSTRELRRRNAEREVALNRRFAPDVYLGVVALDDERDEVVVEMRRMPDDRRLSVVAAGPVERARRCVDEIADRLVHLHADAPSAPEIDRAAQRDAIVELWDQSVGEMRAFAGSLVDASTLDCVAADAHTYAAGREALFARRIADRRVRDGHGDLLADDVFCLDDGPRFLDCLEFDDHLRYADVVADVAFLAMDLERLGHRDLAARLFDAYRRESGDWWPESLGDFYVAYRALVRSKIACLAVAGGDADGGENARRLLGLVTERLARGRVRLVLVGGAPATGKTTFARELGRRTGWTVLHSDEVRKRLAGLEPTMSAADDLDAGLYSSEWTARTYQSMIDAAGRSLSGGESVILDASWSDARQREHAVTLAHATSSALHAFRLSVPAGLADARARLRTESRTDASDASTRLTGPLRARFSPWPEATALDATTPVDAIATSVLDGLGIPS
jgi:aminoglycoside phosphotransferase family enzyme/predicted kinase